MRGNKIRVAIVGVGNCASSLVQGVQFYRDAADGDFIPGLMHVTLGGYHVSDVEFSAAFDVSADKVGRDLSEAVFAPPNNTYRFSDVPRLGVPVHRGPTLDGLGKYLSGHIREAAGKAGDVAKILRDTGTDVVVSYLPVGSERATRWYAERVLEAGCGFVNCIPSFIASDPAWRRRFEERGVPIIGDDIKSQVGATITHRVLTHLFRQRGVRLDRTYQLNFGGNTDFLNMLERERLESKKISKRNAVTSQIDYPISDDNAHIGPSDHVPWLLDRKWCYIRMEGTTFGNVPLNCEVKLEVWDSPNSAGVVIDAVRCAKLALDRGIGGALFGPASYFMKSPPKQFSDDEAHALTEAFIKGEAECADVPAPVKAQLVKPRGANGHAKRNGAKANGARRPGVDVVPVPAKASAAPEAAPRTKVAASSAKRGPGLVTAKLDPDRVDVEAVNGHGTGRTNGQANGHTNGHSAVNGHAKSAAAARAKAPRGGAAGGRQGGRR